MELGWKHDKDLNFLHRKYHQERDDICSVHRQELKYKDKQIEVWLSYYFCFIKTIAAADTKTIPFQLLSKKAELNANKTENLACQVHQMQLAHNTAMDSLKIQHREAMAALKHRYAQAIESKNSLLKEYDSTIEGYEKMFTELLHEMKDKHVSRR